MMNTADLQQAISSLKAKHELLGRQADAINDQMQASVARTTELGLQHSALFAEQSALVQTLETAQVLLFLIGMIDEAKSNDRKASIRIITESNHG